MPVQLGVQASAHHHEVASATAMFLTALEMGGAVGAAISGAIWTHYIPQKLHMYLPPESQADAAEIFGRLTKALSYPMGSATRIAISQAYQETMDNLIRLAVIAALPLIPLSLIMKNYKLDKVGGDHSDMLLPNDSLTVTDRSGNEGLLNNSGSRREDWPSGQGD